MLEKLLKVRSIQVLLALAIYLCAAPTLPLHAHQGLYTISLFIKDILLWILPISVGFFIAGAISSFEKRAPIFIVILFLFEGLSNLASVWYVYGCGHLTAATLPHLAADNITAAFEPLWRLPSVKPAWWSADKGTFAGIILGILASFNLPTLRELLARGKKGAEWVLTQIFSRMIPIFVLGFVARMYKTQILNEIFTRYASLVLWLVLFLAVYIFFLFLIGSGGKTPWKHFKNLLPAGGVAFSSGCSLSTMPWTIAGAGKNLDDPNLAKAIIPATTNIQQIGDCIANTFLCFLIYRHFNGVNPDLFTWVSFSLVFVLARFATAAVIGGAIFIMLPIYESYLGFTPEMIAIILAFNVILDPLITSSNVIANGALCRIFERMWNLVPKPKEV